MGFRANMTIPALIKPQVRIKGASLGSSQGLPPEEKSRAAHVTSSCEPFSPNSHKNLRVARTKSPLLLDSCLHLQLIYRTERSRNFYLKHKIKNQQITLLLFLYNSVLHGCGWWMDVGNKTKRPKTLELLDILWPTLGKLSYVLLLSFSLLLPQPQGLRMNTQ